MPLSGQPSRVSSIPPATVRFNPLIDTMAQSAWGQGKLEQLQSSCAQKDFLRLVHLEKVPASESSEAVKQLFCNGNNAGPLLSHFLRWPVWVPALWNHVSGYYRGSSSSAPSCVEVYFQKGG